ncbi:MAG TPA: FGGY-family carbohydrate kinase, partial [Stellaceae bacterium]|nr:FGGY-family carbohydrate kinase [Stellaceae bacterium]
LGLLPGTRVGASLIDAHAGGVGTIGGLTDRLAYIMGTSACIMATTEAPHFVPGIWGPYFSGMVPGLWLNEGGQSAAGAGIDHLVRSHPAYPELAASAARAGIDPLEFLERGILARVDAPGKAAWLARDLHVLPDFLGNRSPYADPGARAVISGLDLDADRESLERLFVAGLSGLAYGLAEVIEVMQAHEMRARLMVMSGGASRSALVRQIMADTTGLTVALPATAEPVLLGSAMLGAVAAGTYPSLRAAMEHMSGLGALTAATPPALARFHAAKRKVYAAMRRLEAESRTVMGTLEEPPCC